MVNITYTKCLKNPFCIILGIIIIFIIILFILKISNKNVEKFKAGMRECKGDVCSIKSDTAYCMKEMNPDYFDIPIYKIKKEYINDKNKLKKDLKYINEEIKRRTEENDSKIYNQNGQYYMNCIRIGNKETNYDSDNYKSDTISKLRYNISESIEKWYGSEPSSDTDADGSETETVSPEKIESDNAANESLNKSIAAAKAATDAATAAAAAAAAETTALNAKNNIDTYVTSLKTNKDFSFYCPTYGNIINLAANASTAATTAENKAKIAKQNLDTISNTSYPVQYETANNAVTSANTSATNARTYSNNTSSGLQTFRNHIYYNGITTSEWAQGQPGQNGYNEEEIKCIKGEDYWKNYRCRIKHPDEDNCTYRWEASTYKCEKYCPENTVTLTGGGNR